MKYKKSSFTREHIFGQVIFLTRMSCLTRQKQVMLKIIIFSQSVRTLSEKGRGKHRNIMLIGSTNCAKTFLPNPLNMIYRLYFHITKQVKKGLVNLELKVISFYKFLVSIYFFFFKLGMVDLFSLYDFFSN